MIDKNNKSMICTLEMLRRLALNVHGVIDIVDDDNINKMIDMLKQSKVGEWIPASERLPRNYVEVVVCYIADDNETEMDVDFLHENGEWYNAHNRNVIAWQPLPEPYKEGDQGE